jgi:hypothetical protein
MKVESIGTLVTYNGYIRENLEAYKRQLIIDHFKPFEEFYEIISVEKNFNHIEGNTWYKFKNKVVGYWFPHDSFNSSRREASRIKYDLL